jgi:uncharacterized protein YgiM (DUF1202 family)
MADRLLGYRPYEASRSGGLYYFVSFAMLLLVGACFAAFVISYKAFVTEEQKISNQFPEDTVGAGIFVLRPTLTLETEIESPVVPTDVSNSIATVSVHAVNHRAGPGTNYPIVGYSLQGDQVYVFAKNSAGTWLRIDLKEHVWITASAVKLDKDISQIPVADAPP